MSHVQRVLRYASAAVIILALGLASGSALSPKAAAAVTCGNLQCHMDAGSVFCGPGSGLRCIQDDPHSCVTVWCNDT